MKLVINKKFGGFSLSPRAVQRYAELKGKKAYFYISHITGGSYTYTPAKVDEVGKSMFFAFDIPNFHKLSKKEQDKLWDKHYIKDREIDRDDPDLVRTVEELGAAASGTHAKLTVIKIPDDVKYQIDDYDGMESVHEIHRTWY